MLTVQDELKRLAALRERSAAVASALERHRADVSRCIQEIGEARVAGAIDPDQNPARDVDKRCQKLEQQRVAAAAEIDKLIPEVAPLAAEIQKIESGIGARVHAQKLDKQAQIRAAYRAVVERLLQAANSLADLSEQAKSIFDSAKSEFPAEQQSACQEIVLRFAGLRETWSPHWIKQGHGTQRDVFVGAIYDFSADMVDSADPVARAKRHQENFFRERAAQYQAEYELRVNPSPEAKAKALEEARAKGELVFEAPHPLSEKGLRKQGITSIRPLRGVR